MKLYFILIPIVLLTMLGSVAHGSIKDSTARSLRKVARRNMPTAHRSFIWFTPVGVRSIVINGVALGVAAAGDNLRINGVNVELNPFIIIYLPFIVDDVYSNSKYRSGDSIVMDTTTVTTIVNGLSVATLTMNDGRMNGVNVNLSSSHLREMNGVEISGLVNAHEDFNGITAGIVNISTKGKGVQIGVYNYCKSGRVLQIGLINKAGKRILPFVNLKLKDNKDN